MELSYNLMSRYDIVKRELKLIEQYFHVLKGSEDRTFVLDRYLHLLKRKKEIELMYRNLNTPKEE
jgi:hypothetical protein